FPKLLRHLRHDAPNHSGVQRHGTSVDAGRGTRETDGGARKENSRQARDEGLAVGCRGRFLQRPSIGPCQAWAASRCSTLMHDGSNPDRVSTPRISPKRPEYAGKLTLT